MSVQQLSAERLNGLLDKMLLIRNFELTVGEIFAAGKLPGFIHLSVGEEAVPVGVCANLRDDDYITSTHRGHGHCIAKGVGVDAMMAELFGKETGTSRGKGGSMHIFDFSIGMLGANGIVAGGAPLAVGAGLSAKYRKTDQVSVCFFGDAAANQGALHESMNIAGLWKLPVIFVCENNQFGQFTRHEFDSSVPDVSVRAGAYNMPGVVVDGMDVLAVYETVGEAVRRARAGKGPSLVEAKTYRFRGHFEGDQQVYRSQSEVDEWRKKDPILKLKTMMIGRGLISESDYARMEAGAKGKVSNAVRFAEESPAPAAVRVSRGCLRELRVISDMITQTTRELTYVAAVTEALRQEMRRDPHIFLIGENIAVGEGSFNATAGLLKEFGPERVLDTPISEAGFFGASVGAAMTGLKPVVELMFADFMGVTMDQILNQAAKLRYMSGGKIKVPLVVRTAWGGGISAASQHSQSLLSVVTHIPGLKCVAPSTPYDAKGLLISALRQDDPHLLLRTQVPLRDKRPGPRGGLHRPDRKGRGEADRGRRDRRRDREDGQPGPRGGCGTREGRDGR